MGSWRFHVTLYVSDGLILVFGLVVFKCIFELAHPFVVRRKDVALRGLALRVELQQFVGHVFHGLADAGFGLCPGSRAQMVQHRLRAFLRTILLHQIKPSQRNIKPRGVGVFEQHEFRVAVALVDFLQSLILADAVFHMNDIVANLQVAKVGEETLRLSTSAVAAVRPPDPIRQTDLARRKSSARRRAGSIHREYKPSAGSGENFACEVRGFIGITFSAAGAAAQAKGNFVFGEHVRQALDFACVRHGQKYTACRCRISFLTSSIIVGIEPWKRGAGWE